MKARALLEQTCGRGVGWQRGAGGGDSGVEQSPVTSTLQTFSTVTYFPPFTCASQPFSPDLKRTCGAGRQTLRMPSVPECRPGYLGSCRAGCMEKCCLLFMVIIILPASNVAPDMKAEGGGQTGFLLLLTTRLNSSRRMRLPASLCPPLLLLFFQSSSSSSPPNCTSAQLTG